MRITGAKIRKFFETHKYSRKKMMVLSRYIPYGRVKVKPFNFSREVQSTKSGQSIHKNRASAVHSMSLLQ